jgi:hypothetical protein
VVEHVGAPKKMCDFSEVYPANDEANMKDVPVEPTLTATVNDRVRRRCLCGLFARTKKEASCSLAGSIARGLENDSPPENPINPP